MKFQKHNWVKVISLKQDGEVLEVLRSGQYRVAIRDLTLVCEGDDLLLVPGGKREKRKESRAAETLKRRSAESLVPATHSVDLHGMRVEEALKLVESRLDRAILDGAEALRVVHGVGTGRIRTALHAYLKTISAVRHFKPDPENPGVTWIYF